MTADMSALTTWLRAQIDLDQAHAEKDLLFADAAGQWEVWPGVNMPGLVRRDGETLIPEVDDSTADYLGRFKPQQIAERARHQLAEVKAKRAIIDRHAGVPYPSPTGPPLDLMCSGRFGEWSPARADECPEIRILAQPYADRPGWQPEWSVTE
jgi:hypothetical protein